MPLLLVAMPLLPVSIDSALTCSFAFPTLAVSSDILADILTCGHPFYSMTSSIYHLCTLMGGLCMHSSPSLRLTRALRSSTCVPSTTTRSAKSPPLLGGLLMCYQEPSYTKRTAPGSFSRSQTGKTEQIRIVVCYC